jgi:hypothetical protein
MSIISNGIQNSIGLSGSYVTTTHNGNLIYKVLPSTITIPEYTIVFDGEEIKVEHLSSELIMSLASIEMMGWKYYERIKENGMNFSGKIGEVLENKYLTWKRGNKIDAIIETKDVD